MKYHHGDAILGGSLALLFASPLLRRHLLIDPDVEVSPAELLLKRNQTCEEAQCPRGFKLNLRQVNVECQRATCDWRDRETCCIGDFYAEDEHPWELDVPKYLDGAVLLETGKVEGWPELPDDEGTLTVITTPMLREMAMDSFRGCAEAFACEETGGKSECRACVWKHCKGMNTMTQRPKAADWYPSALSGTADELVYRFTSASSFLNDGNGRGDGRKGCAGVDDWLLYCEMDTPGWRSHQGKACKEYQSAMSFQNLFRNESLKMEVKQNCCQTWKCTSQHNCRTTSTVLA